MRRDVYQAIADPSRRAILSIISAQPMTVNQVADHFSTSRPAISKQIKILTECELIRMKKVGRERFCVPNYSALQDIDQWLDQFRIFWNKKLDDLGTFLESE